MIGLFEYFQHWDMMHDILLSQEDNQHSWRLEGSGQFTSKSAYRAFFNGSTTFEPWLRIWKTWAPRKCILVAGHMQQMLDGRPSTEERTPSPGSMCLMQPGSGDCATHSHFMCVCARFLVQDLGSTGPLIMCPWTS